jgi:osomolarity two-component system sensor histidine kinase NIK1
MLTNLFPRGNNNIAVTGVDLTKIGVDVRAEILELKETVNGMTESLSVLADEMTRVAKVGTEGQLEGRRGEGDECWWNLEGSDGRRESLRSSIVVC